MNSTPHLRIFGHALIALLSTPLVVVLLFFPVYTDEITSQLIYNRYWIDDTLIYLFPSCISSFLQVPPLLFHIPYSLQALIYRGENLTLILRAVGLISGVAWIFFLPYLAERLKGPTGSGWWRNLPLSIALHCIGIAPMVLVINRPEHILVWCLGLMLLFWHRHCEHRSKELLWVIPVLFIFFVSAHPKALFFLPFWFLVILTTHYSIATRLLLAVGCCGIAFQGYLFFASRNFCPENPILQAAFRDEILVPAEIVAHPLRSLTTFVSNMAHAFEYSRGLNIRDSYDFGWIPVGSIPLSATLLHVLQLPVGIVLNGVVILTATGFCLYVSRIIRGRRVNRVDFVSFGLAISIVALTGLEQTRLFYETRLFYPAVSLLMILLWSDISPFLRSSVKSAASFLIAGCYIVSIIALWIVIISSFQEWRSLTPIDKKHRHNLPTVDFEAVTSAVNAAAKICQIDSAAPPPGLILDVWTYPSMQLSRRPLEYGALRLYENRTTLEPLFETRQSGGLVLRCDSLRELTVTPGFKQVGNFCCFVH